MKNLMLKIGLLVLAAVCLFQVLVNSGCITKPSDEQSSFKVKGLERAAGPQSDTPVIY